MEATRYVFSIGGLQITSTVVTTWGLLLVFCLFREALIYLPPAAQMP